MNNIVSGLTYIGDFINRAEEKSFITNIDNTVWQPVLLRRVQQYGFPYDYKKRTILPGSEFIEFPDWIKPLAEKIFTMGFIKKMPDQIIINEYEPGSGIANHIDSEQCFDDTIVILSLNSGIRMDFCAKNNDKPEFFLYLDARSLLVITGEARYNWLHGIKPVKTDITEKLQIKRKRRISISLRNAKI